jgi:hypothetical protein
VISGGHQYWIVMSGVSSGDVTWNADGNGQEGAATIIAPDLVNDIAAQWSLLPQYTQGAFLVQGTLLPGPEPGTSLILGSGLIGIVLIARRLNTLQ